MLRVPSGLDKLHQEQFYERDSSVPQRLPQRSLEWGDAVWVINASVLGMGVLCVPYCFAKLGWIVGIVATTVCLLTNVFVACLMQQVQVVQPYAISLPDAAFYACGYSERAKNIVRFVLYTEKLACTCPAITLITSMVGSSFNWIHICRTYWLLLVCICLLPWGLMKSIKDTQWLNLVNMVTVVAAVLLMAVYLCLDSDDEVETSFGLPNGLSASASLGYFKALSMLVYAFNGNWMYFEVMSEMTVPTDFMKAFAFAGPMQIVIYIFIGSIGYASWGANVPGSIMDAMSFGPVQASSCILLAIHTFCGTIISTVILVRFLQSRISVKMVNKDTFEARSVRFFLTLVVYIFCFIVASAVPSFSNLVSLLGAVLEAPISFILPVFIYVGIMCREPKGFRPSLFMWIMCAVVATLGLVLAVLGTYSALYETGEDAMDPPFSCTCVGFWNTCDCSPTRLPEGTCPMTLVKNHSHAALLWTNSLDPLRFDGFELNAAMVPWYTSPA